MTIEGHPTCAAFHARGHHVVTDDVAAVHVQGDGQCLLRAAGSRLRLFDDSTAVFRGMKTEQALQWDKHLFDVTRGELRNLIQVCHIYKLTYGNRLSLESIPPLEAVAVLSQNSIVKHLRLDKDALAAHLRECATVAGAVRVFELIRPRSLSDLPDLVHSIETELGRTDQVDSAKSG